MDAANKCKPQETVVAGALSALRSLKNRAQATIPLIAVTTPVRRTCPPVNVTLQYPAGRARGLVETCARELLSDRPTLTTYSSRHRPRLCSIRRVSGS